jgi:hypothetical protein
MWMHVVHLNMNEKSISAYYLFWRMNEGVIMHFEHGSIQRMVKYSRVPKNCRQAQDLSGSVSSKVRIQKFLLMWVPLTSNSIWSSMTFMKVAQLLFETRSFQYMKLSALCLLTHHSEFSNVNETLSENIILWPKMLWLFCTIFISRKKLQNSSK